MGIFRAMCDEWRARGFAPPAGLLVMVTMMAILGGGGTAAAQNQAPATTGTQLPTSTFDALVLIFSAAVTAIAGAGGGVLGAKRSLEQRIAKLERSDAHQAERLNAVEAEADILGDDSHWHTNCLVVLAAGEDLPDRLVRRGVSVRHPEPASDPEKP